eukprot:CAMPEP_0174296702 /NCGR_PEP_ID=MMETSP0809-20121228/48682_1 /TAXON_ID=73025 ORGANISM="Eutreptiella gymnastica-like, Strain CCMP1594" /NCGR_SAMPLE_ID=MMETSP0809 /ASSEMBLY_ACC=CAM_ASM_000658 /LENGTH=215 /DNA_ID=CAMNT_0015399883 /DNA_START=159 /DNA_END=803 /DNA_ORIENTATION=+
MTLSWDVRADPSQSWPSSGRQFAQYHGSAGPKRIACGGRFCRRSLTRPPLVLPPASPSSGLLGVFNVADLVLNGQLNFLDSCQPPICVFDRVSGECHVLMSVVLQRPFVDGPVLCAALRGLRVDVLLAPTPLLQFALDELVHLVFVLHAEGRGAAFRELAAERVPLLEAVLFLFFWFLLLLFHDSGLDHLLGPELLPLACLLRLLFNALQYLSVL